MIVRRMDRGNGTSRPHVYVTVRYQNRAIDACQKR
jgi:hypothetical protein